MSARIDDSIALFNQFHFLPFALVVWLRLPVEEDAGKERGIEAIDLKRAIGALFLHLVVLKLAQLGTVFLFPRRPCLRLALNLK